MPPKLSAEHHDLLVSSRPYLGVMAAVLAVNSQQLDGLATKRVGILLYIRAKWNQGCAGRRLNQPAADT